MKRPTHNKRVSLGTSLFATLLLVGMIVGVILRLPGFAPPQTVAALLQPSHLAMIVPDFERTRRWYQDKLGFSPLTAPGRQQGDVARALLIRDGNLIEIIGGNSAKTYLRLVGSGAPPVAVRRIPVIVDNIDREVAALKERGVEIITSPRESRRTPFRVATVRDPNGNVIDLQQPF